ncbi:MAG: hypothetical protein ACRDFB_00930 [Rhabdochlamydiaceae bacterium]
MVLGLWEFTGGFANDEIRSNLWFDRLVSKNNNLGKLQQSPNDYDIEDLIRECVIEVCNEVIRKAVLEEREGGDY